MNVPTRLLILQRLCALLADTPVVVNGVQVIEDGEPKIVGVENVHRGRNLLGEESIALEMLPVLSIIESPRPDNSFFAGENEAGKEEWTLLITGFAEDDKLNPNDNAYYLHAELQKRLSMVVEKKRSGSAAYPEFYMLGGAIYSLVISPPVVRPPEDKLSSKAFMFLPIRVGVVGAMSDPYTQVP